MLLTITFLNDPQMNCPHDDFDEILRHDDLNELASPNPNQFLDYCQGMTISICGLCP